MKSLVFFSIFSLAVLYGASTTVKINDSKKNLSVTTTAKKKASRHLDKIAKDIKSAEKDIVYLEKKIDTLKVSQLQTEKKFNVLKAELSEFDTDLKHTTKKLENKQNKFISLLSEQLSIVFAMNQAHEPTESTIVLHEVYKAYKKQNSKTLALLRSDIELLRESKKAKVALRSKTQKKIATMRDKRKLFAQKKVAKEKLLKKLSTHEEKYNAKLEKIVDKQNSLRSTLAKLNILHSKEVEVARKRAMAKKEAMRLEKQRQREIRRAKAKARTKARLAREALLNATTSQEKATALLASKEAEAERRRVYKSSAKVKQVNSSYKKSKTYNYRGSKTISPLYNARVIKRFGTYTDPIYKIKIFNESITLKSNKFNAKVKNVLNGKVVFAGKSSMLGKVVVVEHSRKIHTVYAGLSKIAPTIHVGSKIKKGYVVGKVSRKLIFQATKNSKHINPLQLIKL